MKHILPLLNSYSNVADVSFVGTSELGKKIPLVTIGHGNRKVLIWSQMHGNESTTTKALLDFIAFTSNEYQKSTLIDAFLTTHTLKIIPILNPDGAERYTRENANGIDLNRDAQDLTQKESQALRTIFKEFKPDLCLNMHDQRTIYGVSSGKSATISFLSPAADESRGLTNARKSAMLDIVKMYKTLLKEIPGQIGRYDDGFNINCVGDTFTSLGIPTILFEAGHYPEDYSREITRSLIFKALLAIFNISEEREEGVLDDYFTIPENKKSHCDIVLKNVRLEPDDAPLDIAIQYTEVLKGEEIIFIPQVIEFNTLLIGHKEIECNGDHLVFNNTKTVYLNENVHFLYNKSNDIPISLNI